MKIYKIDLHITGTIIDEEPAVKNRVADKKNQQAIKFNPETESYAGAVTNAMGKKDPSGKCNITNCSYRAVSKGLCNKHYQRWYKTGKKLRGA